MRRLAGAAIVFVLAAPAAAQGPDAPPPSSGRARDRFEISLRLQGSFDDNVLQTDPPTDGQYIGDAIAGLGYRHQWRRSWLSLGGQAGAQRYSSIAELSRADYGGQGTLALTLFRRTKLTLNQTYTSSYTRDIPELAAEGLVLPLVLANRADSTIHFERPLTSSWQFEAEGRYQRVDFPSRALSNGAELTVFPSIQRRVGRYASVALGYAFEQGWSGDVAARAHGVLAGARRKPPKGLGYVLLAGDAYLEGTRRNTPIGTAELSFNRRHDRVTAHYDRSVRHAFGLGRQVVSDLVSLNISRDLARRLSVGASGTIGINNDPRDRAFRYRSDAYRGSFQWAVTRELSATAGFVHWRSTVGRGVVTPNNRGWLSLAYRLGF